MARKSFPPIKLGPLPFQSINAALGTELDPGDVWVSKDGHRHMALDHPADYPFIMAALVEMVRGPLYVGQDPKHGRNFYLVKPLPAGAPNPHGLVAISLQKNDRGVYTVRTAYSISQDTVNQRRSANRLHRVI